MIEDMMSGKKISIKIRDISKNGNNKNNNGKLKENNLNRAKNNLCWNTGKNWLDWYETHQNQTMRATESDSMFRRSPQYNQKRTIPKFY